MNIVIITGSPHRHGTSALLVERFTQGAVEAGHQVFRFDAAFQKIHPCIACRRCRTATRAVCSGTIWTCSTPGCWRQTWWSLPRRSIIMTGPPS